MTTDPCKMQAICEAAMEWYEARQDAINPSGMNDIMDRFHNLVNAEEKLAELISKGR